MFKPVLIVCAVSVSASAQQLSGPEVEVVETPGVETRLGADGSESRVPMRVYLRALRELRGEKTTSITPEQREQIEPLVRAFMKEAAAYEREHRSELRTLRRDAERFDEMDENAPPVDGEALRDRAKTVRMEAPDPSDTQRKIWALLDEDQRAALGANIEAWENERSERRAEARAQRTVKDRVKDIPERLSDEQVRALPIPDEAQERLLQLSPEDRAKAVMMDDADRRALRDRLASLDRITDEMLEDLPLPERAKRRLKRLSPEARADAVRRTLNRGSRDRRSPPAQKPAPGMDGVDLPDPG